MRKQTDLRANYLDMKRRDLSPEQNDRVRALLRALVGTYGSETALAKALEVKQPTISSVLSGRHGTSWGLLHRVAKLAGVPPAELLGEPVDEVAPVAHSPGLRAFLASNEGRSLALTVAEVRFLYAVTNGSGIELTAHGYLGIAVDIRRAVSYALALHRAPDVQKQNTVSEIRTSKKRNG